MIYTVPWAPVIALLTVFLLFLAVPLIATAALVTAFLVILVTLVVALVAAAITLPVVIVAAARECLARLRPWRPRLPARVGRRPSFGGARLDRAR